MQPGDPVFGLFASGEQRQGLILIATALFGLRVGKMLTCKSRALKGDAIYVEPGIRRIYLLGKHIENIHRAELLFKGNTTVLLKQLEGEMKQFAKNDQFEMAKIRRDRILMMLENFN